MKPPLPPNEPQRLKILHDYAALDTLPEKALDDLTTLASHICETPISLISLIDERRQWFKSRVGLNVTETAREISFCGHGILQTDLLVVPDATQDARFADNPLVTEDPNIRFYAGTPLIAPGGEALGMFCIMDRVPRQLSLFQQEALRILGHQTMIHLEFQRQARELKARDERLRLVTDNAQVGLVILDRQRRYAYANQTYNQILGLGANSILGRHVAEVLPALYPQQIGPRLDLAFAGKRVSYELHQPESDRYYTVSYEPTGVLPEIQSVVVVITDITLAKQAEIASRRLASIVEFSDDAIIGKNLQSTVTSWNRGAEKLFGYTEAEMVGTSITRLIPPDRQAEEAFILGRINQGESVEHFETLRLTKEGRSIHVSVTASPIKDAAGRVTGVSKIARDITARKRIESRFRRLVDSPAQGVLFWNASGGIEDANGAFLQLIGYTREDLTAGRINWKALTPPEYADLDRRGLEELALHGVCRPFEKEYIRRDGSRLPVLVGAATFEDNPQEGVCFVVDLAERKKLEQQFLRAQRMESIGTLAGGIAHDLNNLLSPIIMGVGLLRLEATPRDLEIIESIERASHRGADLVKQVLSFARGVEGARIASQIRHIIREVKSIAENTFPKNIEITTHLPNDLWLVLADPTQLNQVVLNLCVNARDAMPSGGRLEIKADNVEIDEQYAVMNQGVTPGRYVMIQVNDSGCGMPKEIVDRIFEPFFTTKEIGKGTGLGLSTVLGIVRSHAGFVNVYSEPGKGSAFKVYLPAQSGAGPAETPEPALEKFPRGNGELILVVDDEASILDITKQTLRVFGYKVVTAEDGAQAIGIYAMHRAEIALVLTDMMMPVMDGPALIAALRRIDPKARIIAASGLNANANVARAASAGVKHFLAKPYSADTMLTLLKQVLGEP